MAKPSRRWETARRKVNRLHTRVGNLRKDGLHKLTTSLVATYNTIVVEDLHVAGMVRNRRLAQAISDLGFGEIRRQLDYKARWSGSRLVVADRWFPSSKTCSGCQTAKPKLSLSVRTFTCELCGLAIDRDLNAARNLEQYVAQSGWETQNGRGADRKTGPGPAGGCEASTPHQLAEQTGDLRLATGGSPRPTQIR
jgi:putative transposase